MKIVILKNGKEESEALVNLVMKIIRIMFSLDPSLVYHLHRLCTVQNAKQNMSYYFIGKFKECGLLDDEENIPESICNIILSAVKIYGVKVTISSPLMD